MGSDQSTTDYIAKLDAINAEYARAATSTTTTSAPPLEFHNEADLSTHNDVSVESSDSHLDQSNHGFSFVNIPLHAPPVACQAVPQTTPNCLLSSTPPLSL